MSDLQALICKALLEREEGKKRSSLTSYLSPAFKRNIEEQAESLQDPLKGFESFKERIANIHPQRISFFLRKFNLKEQELFLALLPQEMQQSLQRTTTLTLSAKGTEYFQYAFTKLLFNEADALLPVELLPHSALNMLLTLKPEMLENLIFHLGLQSLAEQMRTVLDATIIQGVMSALSPIESSSMIRSMRQPKVLILESKKEFPSNTDPLAIRFFCKKEGTYCLAKSLSQKHPALTQHLCQALDEEGANMLRTACQLPESKETDYHIDQVLEMVKFLQGVLK